MLFCLLRKEYEQDIGAWRVMLKLLVAEDHPLYREALIGALQPQFGDVNFIESDSLNSTLNMLRRCRNISLILLDLNMPGCDNFYGLLRIHQLYPDIPILVLSGSDSLHVIAQTMKFGARGFIPKTSATRDLVKGIQSVLAGNTYLPNAIAQKIPKVDETTIEIAQKVRELTPKQFTVLKLLKKGLMNRDIAAELGVTEATVKAHIGNLFKRLDARSRTQVLVAIEKLQLE
jgi:DNA-binding NarL/FixJ family response regulator